MKLYHDLCEGKPRRAQWHLAKVSNTAHISLQLLWETMWGKKVHIGHRLWPICINRKAAFFFTSH